MKEMESGEKFYPRSRSNSPTGAGAVLHPCLRGGGVCEYEGCVNECPFRKYPADSCLDHLKGRCNDAHCAFRHVRHPPKSIPKPIARRQLTVAEIEQGIAENGF